MRKRHVKKNHKEPRRARRSQIEQKHKKRLQFYVLLHPVNIKSSHFMGGLVNRAKRFVTVVSTM